MRKVQKQFDFMQNLKTTKSQLFENQLVKIFDPAV